VCPAPSTADEAPGVKTRFDSRRLILAHFWLAFAFFGVALVLGAACRRRSAARRSSTPSIRRGVVLVAVGPCRSRPG
jgi:hypothetical protein